MELAIYHNVIAPYKKPFFRAICEHFPGTVTLFTSSASRPRRSEWGEQDIQAENLNIRRLPAVETRGLQWYNPSISYHMLTHDYDVLMTGDYFFISSILSTWAARLRNIPCALYSVATHKPHFADPGGSLAGRLADDLYQTTVFDRVIKPTVRQYDLYFTPSSTSRRHLVSLGADPRQISKVYNPVDTEKFSPSSKPSQESDDTMTLCYVGRLVPEKGLHNLIQAIAMLDCEVSVLIVGDGELRSELERQASQRGVADRITFFGRLPHDEIPSIHARSDAFVLPSLPEETNFEQFPNALLEAMASGLPTVTYDIAGGIQEIHTDGVTGTKASKLTPSSLADAIERLFEDDHETYGQNARQHILDQFSPNTVGKQYADALVNLATEYGSTV
ncbi:glycosyltransferase family 4 protein [Haloarcula sp. CBA1122]|uniref:glycosyltransferase family 4 protein n=1 Tax=Haloarcula sp. CBA1122 TaxID=2668069 RepID=UPI0018D24619|nr:glycosyltransferase family 4 protein [Haloarcula sp. CBA1122]